jgi:dihydroorotate dehydrogenase electron transfer subunit
MHEQTAAVVDRTEIARDIVRLDIRPERWDAVAPGQFVHAAVEGSFLRRPVSIAGADEKSGTLSLIVQKIGAGTARLSEYAKGDTLKLLYPLGRGFDAERLNSAGRQSGVWLVGGGVGVAPLLLLARRLSEAGHGLESFAGFRASEYVYGVEELERYGPLFTSVGELVTDPLRARLRQVKQKRPAAIAACGPVPMLKAVQALCSNMVSKDGFRWRRVWGADWEPAWSAAAKSEPVPRIPGYGSAFARTAPSSARGR